MSTSEVIGEQRNFNKGVAGTNDNAAENGTLLVFVRMGGIADQTGTRVANLDDAILKLNRFGGTTPERQAVLIGTLVGAGATTTASLGSATNIGQYKQAQFLIDVTATGGATASLTVYVDSRLDGTTYMNLAAAAVMTTASRQVVQIQKEFNANNSTIITNNAGAGTIRNVGFADDLQVRYTISGATSTFDARVWVNLIG